MNARRPGITLVEVLIAIFIMGIGMLAILVLFPLGALNMLRALKDDRCGSIAPNADSLATAFSLRTDSSIINPGNGQGNFYLFPLGDQSQNTPTKKPFKNPDDNGLSYPVYVDPYYSIGGLSTVGTGTGVIRVSPSYVSNTTNPIGFANRWFSLLDDLYFNPNGQPVNFTSIPAIDPQRQGYYTYAYMLRREKALEQSPVNLTVIVYKGRPVQAPVMESVCNVTGATQFGTSMTLTPGPGQALPDLRRGNWLLDVSYSETTTSLGAPSGYVNAKFYKVMDAVNIAGSLQVNVYPQIQDQTVNQVVVLDSAVEVFDRGTGR